MSVEVLRACSFLQIPEVVVTEQDFSSLLQAVIAKLPTIEDAISSKVVLEVEVAHTKRNSERRLLAIQAELKEAQHTIASLSKEGAAVLQHPVISPSELEVAKTRITSLENSIVDIKKEKEQALSLFDRQSKVLAQREADLLCSNKNAAQMRQKISQSELNLQQALTRQSDLEFSNQTILQELEFTKRHTNWLDAQLEKSVQDLSNSRSQQGKVLVTTQNDLELCRSEFQAVSAQNIDLQNSASDLQSKLKDKIAVIAEIKVQSSQREDDFHRELENQVRLTQLWETSVSDAKNRVVQLEGLLSKAQGQLEEQQELRMNQDHAQQTIGRLEDEIIDLRTRLANTEPAVAGPVGAISMGTILMQSTANSSERPVMTDDNASYTLSQLYAAYENEKRRVLFEQRKCERVQKGFDNLIQELEARAPELQEQREEFLALQHEIGVLGQQLQAATSALEAANMKVLAQSTTINDQERAYNSNNQTIRDLARQVQRLLFEVEEQGFAAAPLSEVEITALNQLLAEPSLEVSNVQAVITDRLVLFKSIQEMQAQNEELLKLTREMGHKLEAAEAEPTAVDETVQEAQDTIEKLTRSLRNLQSKLTEVERERDSFRSMMPAQSLQLMGASAKSTIAINGHEDVAESDEARYAERESGVNFDMLNQEIAQLRKERTELTARLARSTAQIELNDERVTMLNNSLATIRKDASDLRKRYDVLQDRYAAQEIKYQSLSDTLLDTKTLLTSAKSEINSLQVEKELLKSIESRAQGELEVVRQERDRLASRAATIQALSEHAGSTHSEAIQRLELRLQQSDEELQLARQALTDERHEIRRLTMGREAYSTDTQGKLQVSANRLLEITAQLASVTAERDSAISRIGEYEKQVASNARRLEVLESLQNGSHTSNNKRTVIDLDDARNELENMRSDLRQAQSEAEHLQELATQAEQELQQFQIAHETFVTSAEEQLLSRLTLLEGARGEIVRLTKRQSELQAEVDNAGYSQKQKADILELQLRTAQDEIVHMQQARKDVDIALKYVQDDLRTQADIAQDAQQNYETELLRHAEAAQALKALRQDYSVLHDVVITAQGTDNLLESQLRDAQRSWDVQKSLYERELDEARARLHDLQQQNALLHEQFDKMVNVKDPTTENNSGNSTQTIESLQTILQFVRREKDILVVKHEILQQENKRLSQQLVVAQKSAEDAQSSLARERHTIDLKHQELQTTTSSLKESIELLRTSNRALRLEHDERESKLQALQEDLQSSLAKIEPLQMRCRTLEADLESSTSTIEMLQTDNERWKKRNQAILQKYDRIDPTELQELKTALQTSTSDHEQARIQLSKLSSSLMEQKQQLESTQAELQLKQTLFDKLQIQSKERIGKERKDAKQVKAENEQLLAQKENLEQQLQTAQSELENLQERTSESNDKSTAELVQRIEQLTEAKDQEISELKTRLDERDLTSNLAAQATGQGDSQSAEPEKASLELVGAKKQAEHWKAQFDKLREIAKRRKEEVSSLKARLVDLESQSNNLKPQDEVPDALSTNPEGSSAHPATPAGTSSTELEITQRVSAAKEQEKQEALAQQAEELEANALLRIREAISTHSNDDLRNVQTMQPNQDELQAERARHAQELADVGAQIDQRAKLKARQLTQTRIDALVENRLSQKLEKAKQEWLSEQPSLASSSDDKATETLLAQKELEFQQRLAAKEESVKKEVNMRNTLLQKKLEKQIETLKQQLATKNDAHSDGETKNEPSHDEGSEHEEVTSASTAPVTTARPARRGRGRGRGGLKRQREDAPEGDSPMKKTAT